MTDLSRRHLLLAGAAAALPAAATAQEAYPARPLRVVIPYAAGGGTDTVFNIVRKAWEKSLGGTLVPEYAGGAGTLIGTLRALQAPANGYTVLLTTSAVSLNTVVLDDAKYRWDDVEIIGPLVQYPYMLIVNSQVPVNSLKEFVAHAKAHRGKLNFVSLGVGSPTFLLTDRMRQAMGIEIEPIAYAGSSAAQTDFMADRVQLQLVAASKQYISAPNQKILAVASEERIPLLPDTPTFAEMGYRDMVGGTWFGVFAPKGMPAPVLARLRQSLAQAVQEVSAEYVASGHFLVPGGTEAFPRYIAADLARWKADFARVGSARK